MVKAASGLKKFLTSRLSKLNTILARDSGEPEQKVYLVEEEPKHPDSWENAGDGNLNEMALSMMPPPQMNIDVLRRTLTYLVVC